MIEQGYSFYGQYIGVVAFANTAPRVPGDAGHAASYSYPVRFEVIEGSFRKMLAYDPAMRDSIRAACLKLKAQGVRGILSDCGMMSLYQDSLGAELGIPFMGSSLCLIPTVWQMIGRQGTIGVLTGHSGLLSEKHLRASGWTDDIRLTVQGLQEEPHFAEIVINGGHDLDVVKMNRDMLNAAAKLRGKAPDLRAVIIECSNLATYARNISDLLKVPVFDTIAAANLLSYCVHPPVYPEA